MSHVSAEAVRPAVRSVLPGIRQELEQLIRVPSVSAAGFDPAGVRRSAEAAAGLLERSGFAGVRLLEADGAHPAVFGHVDGPAGTPTVLLYAHHDVQPAGPEQLWASPPFVPAERDGRLYGRGAADDKAGIAAHAAAMQAWNGEPPVGVTVFIEGEEEIASPHLSGILSRHADVLRADAVVIADCSNWRIGQPALTTSLRGLAECVVEVRTLDHGVHSGNYGGPVPDALTCLCRLLATLHDDAGNVAVHGLASGPSGPLDLAEAEFRSYAGIRPGVRLLGEGPLTARLWTWPSVSVLGIDAPRTADSANQLVPSARARLSLRLAPGDDPARAMGLLASHLRARAPWGAEVAVQAGKTTAPCRVNPAGPAFGAFRRACAGAWGREPVETGIGGSMPFATAVAGLLPDAAVLLTGIQDPCSNAHAENESLHLGDFQAYCVAKAMLLAYFAG